MSSNPKQAQFAEFASVARALGHPCRLAAGLPAEANA